MEEDKERLEEKEVVEETEERKLISRLRMGHTGLNKTLYLISKHPTELCEWCGQDKTVQHAIIRKYDEERKWLREEVWRVEGKELTLKSI